MPDRQLKLPKGNNPMKPQTFVFASGGCVVGVTDRNGQDYPGVCVIDYDNAENGGCPVCGAEIYPEDPTCSICGFEWASDDDTQGKRAIAAALALRGDEPEEPESPLLWAAKLVVARWQSGDLAEAVRALHEAIELQEGK